MRQSSDSRIASFRQHARRINIARLITSAQSRIVRIGILALKSEDEIHSLKCSEVLWSRALLRSGAGCDSATSDVPVLGIFLSPLLILMYLPTFVADVDLVHLIVSLVLRVLVPLVIGQLVQKTLKGVYEFFIKHRPIFKKVPELLLVFII